MPCPAFSLYDHQDLVPLDLDALTRLAVAAWPLVLAVPGTEPPVLPELEEVEVSFLDDAAIGRVHGEFLDDPTPTDVITFAHGEILISAETAAANAPVFHHTPQQEAALYLIHGLLHLNGHEDHTAAGAAGMKTAQERILREVGTVSPPTDPH